MKLTLTKVIRKDTDKDGNKLITKDGRPWTRLAIQAQEYGQNWVTGFSSPWNQNWKEGDVVEADVEDTADGKYHNLKRPDPVARLAERVLALEKDVAGLKTLLDPQREEKTVRDTDLPF